MTMVQMPAVNTPQFSWVLSRLPDQAQPVPPIYQPEVAAKAVLFAADHPKRREYWVGGSTAATLAAISTAYANNFSHTARIGIAGAVVLSLLTFAIVEFSTFTLEDGLRETFKGGTQRLLAKLTYWAIRVTMIANGALLSCFIAGVTPPAQLRFWSHWSFAFHLGVGLVLIPLIRNADPVVAHRMLELKAATATLTW